MRTTTAVMIAVSTLVLGGCGGDDDEPSSDPADAAADEPTGEPATEEPPSDDAGESAGGASTATISVGDQTFDFEWEPDAIQRCDPDFFGGFLAIAATTSDEASFEAELFPEGTAGAEDRAPKIEVSAAGNAGHWTADPDETIGTTFDSWPAMVESFEIDGNRASGTAVFVGDTVFGEEPEGIPGSFEIVCND